MNNQQILDFALVNYACNGTPLSHSRLGDKAHENNRPIGDAQVRPGKIQVASGLGFYRSFPLNPKNIPFRDRASWFPGSSEMYAHCKLIVVARSGGVVGGKVVDNGYRATLQYWNGEYENVNCDEGLFKFFTACVNIQELRNANSGLFSDTPVDVDEETDEDDDES